MSNLLIRQCLESVLKAFSLLKNPPIPIAYENIIFDNKSSIYFECNLYPSKNITETLDGKHNCYSGIFEITIVAKKGYGYSESGLLAEALAYLYKCDSKFEYGPISLKIIEPPSILNAITTEREYRVPISITYRVDYI